MAVDDKARRAASFGGVADVYERARPGYPAAAIEWTLGLEPLEVLDLGAGTGKLTAALLGAGHRVTALEPLAEMRAILVETLPAAKVLEGRAEELPLADGSVDAVVAGSAFHWFDRGPALDEIGRVLRPPGVFALLGNRFDTSVDWQRHLRRVNGGASIYRRDHWPSRPDLHTRFAEVADRSFAHRMEIDRDWLRDYYASTSRLATMEAAERAERLARIDAVWDEEPELRGRPTATLLWRTPVRRSAGSLA